MFIVVCSSIAGAAVAGVLVRILMCVCSREWNYYFWDTHDFLIDCFWSGVSGAIFGLLSWVLIGVAVLAVALANSGV